MRPLIVDALGAGRSGRRATLDVIGAGPRAVAGVFEARGIEARVASPIVTRDAMKGYGMLLVSGMTSDLFAVRRTVSDWRKASGGPVLIGGPIASNPEVSLVKTGGDICVIGEGEEALGELLDLGLGTGAPSGEEELDGVRGVAFRREEEVVLNPLRPVMRRETYDGLRPSTLVIRDYRLYRAARVYVEVLRGCSNYRRARIGPLGEWCSGCGRCVEGGLEERYYCPEGIPPGCGYCSVPSLYGPPKSRSVERIREEVGALLSEGVRRVVLSAPDFLDYGRDLLVEPEPLTDPRHPEPNYDALEALLSSITGLGEVADGEASIMIENVKPALVTERASKILGEFLKGSPVSVGFETGSLSHSDLLGRPSTPGESLTALRLLKGAGLRPYVYFIHGLPGQDAETAAETVGAIRSSAEAGAERVILYRFQPLPMSAFGGLPSAPPAVKDPLSRKIYSAARRANRRRKEALLGRRIRVVVAEPYDRDPRLKVAYPMLHGPVVLIEGAEGIEGGVVGVEVTHMASDRMVRGCLVDGMF